MQITEDQIYQLIDKYKRILKLSVWDIFFTIKNDKSVNEAESKVNSTYYQLDIVLNIAEIRNEEHLEKTIIHELVHALVVPYEFVLANSLEKVGNNEFYETVADQELENLVTHIERVVYDLSKENAI